MTEEIDPKPWSDGTGTIAERTDVVINGLLDWANKSGANSITRKNITDAVKQLTPVGSEDTVDQYVKRVTRHGPFAPKNAGLWKIKWDRVYSDAESTSSDKAEARHD